MNRKLTLVLAVTGALLATRLPLARASVQVVGGSNLLTSAYEAQLESWLGQGSITLTNIFDHAAGDGKTSYDFHAAADGQGPTITLIKVLGGAGFHYDFSTGAYNYPDFAIGEQLIGGYNPQSWTSSWDYNYTPADADRTAFLFNLTNSVKQDQKLSTDSYGSYGQYQIYNDINYGPTFGAGHDLYVDSSLTQGSAVSYSYGDGAYYTTNPDDILIEIGQNGPGDYSYAYSLIYGDIEVFSIAPLAVAAPEAASLVVWSLLACAGAVCAGWRRAQAVFAPSSLNP